MWLDMLLRSIIWILLSKRRLLYIYIYKSAPCTKIFNKYHLVHCIFRSNGIQIMGIHIHNFLMFIKLWRYLINGQNNLSKDVCQISYIERSPNININKWYKIHFVPIPWHWIMWIFFLTQIFLNAIKIKILFKKKHHRIPDFSFMRYKALDVAVCYVML